MYPGGALRSRFDAAMLAPAMSFSRRPLRLRYFAGLVVASCVAVSLLCRPSGLLEPAVGRSAALRFPGASWRWGAGAPVMAEAAVPAANATLGFGRIYAVSGPDSPRRPALLRAANVTELSITVPEQPRWTDEDKQRLRMREGSVIASGSMFAWLGHLHALTEYVYSLAGPARA